MEITYQGLRIILPLEGVIQVEDFTFEASFNHHASVSMLLLMDEEGLAESVHQLSDGACVEIYESKILFIGKVSIAETVQMKGLHYLKLKAVSYTKEWELTEVSQSFLNLDATYEQVMRKVLENQTKADICDCITEGAVIPDFLLQYEESDWDFLIRLASHFQTYLIPDYTEKCGRVYFGIPKYEEELSLSEDEYQTIKDMDHYYHVDVVGELMTQDFMRWEVKTGRSFVLAQKIRFRGISTIVTNIRYVVVDGELCRCYELSREKGCLRAYQKNANINGMSIPATVKERSGNCVRVHFQVDQEYDSSPNVKFFTYAIESSFIYCMPEVGSQVHIYFPSDEERDAIAVHAIRMSGGSGGQSGASGGGGGGYAQNPDYKSFSNVNGAELLLTPTSANAAADADKAISVHLDTSGNAFITGKEIEIKSTKNLSLGESAKSVILEAKKLSVLIGETGIELSEEAKITAAFVKLDASDATPASNPSAEEILESVTAGYESMKDSINEGVSQQLVDKYEEGRAKVLGGVVTILTTVATVAVVVGLTIATGGMAALAAPAVLGTFALAGTTTVFAVSEIMEGSQDMQKAMSGDLSQSYNFLRDTLFMGSQTAYNIAKMVNSIAFGIVSGKAMANAFKIMADTGKIYQFACNSNQLKSLKSAIQVGGNVMNGALNDLVYTGKIDLGNLAFNTGLGMIQGQIGSRLTDGALGRLGISGLSPTARKAATAAVGTVIDTGMDGVMSWLTGREFDFGDSLARNAFANTLAAFISDPVDAVTGCYIIRSTDFILASIPAAVKLERTYRSTGQSSSVMGRGWSFTYGNKIYRDTHKVNRIHLEAITGHALWFEKQEGRWINQSKGAAGFVLEADEEQKAFSLKDIVNHTVCYYNEKGQLAQVEYPNRQRLLFAYTEDGLSRITTPLGNILEVTSEAGKILQITDEIGRKTQYRYEQDYLTDVINTDEGITHYEYDEQGYIVSVTDQNGVRYLENRFDEQGRITRQMFESGVCQEFSYDDKNHRNTVTFSETGKKEIYEYNDAMLTDRIIYEDGTCVTYEYSEDHLRTGELSRTGATTSWEYDSRGRLTGETKTDGFRTYHEYDQNHDLVRVWDTDQRETCYEYDEDHNRTAVRERIGDGQWKETVSQYDTRGRQTTVRDGAGNTTRKQYEENRAYPSRVITPKGEETVYEYDRVGRRMSVGNAYGTVLLSYNSRNFVTGRTDGEGYTSHWIYDKMGNLTTYYPAKHWENQEAGYEYRYDFLERLTDTISPLKEHQRMFRNFDGDIIREIHPVSYQEKKEDGEGTQYVYDWDGNCIRILYADGGTQRRFYDAAGNLTKQVMPESYDKTTDDGPGYTYTYDKRGRLIQVQEPEGATIRRYEYNGHDQVICETDGEGKETRYSYNGLGQRTRQQVSIRQEDNTTYYHVIAYRYDQQGNKTEEAYGREEVKQDQEPAGWHRIQFSYDGNNHLIAVKDEFGARVRYDYDCLGNLTLEEQIMEEGIRRRIRYGYNKNGWRICKEEEIRGNGDTHSAITHYEYDPNGNLIRIKTPKGFEIRRTYDGNNRLTEERTLDKKNGIDRRVCYNYDAAGNQTSVMVKGAGGESLRTQYQYDLKDRLTHQIRQNGATTRYLYDQNDRLIKAIRPYGYEEGADKGAGTTYRYDSRGNRILETNGLHQVVEELTYNLQNQPEKRQDGMGGQTEYTYTLDEQIKEIRRGHGEKEQILQRYEYNAKGQITGITDGVGERIQYDVDSWGRITNVGFSDGVTEGYTYTPSGQVSTATDGNGNTVIYQYNSLGKVRARIDQLGDQETFQYDEEGNLALHIDRDGNQITRNYNVFGNPVYERAVDKNGTNAVITSYRYDSLGRLTRAICDGHSYEYEYNKDGQLKEKRSSGKRLISYEYDKAGQVTAMTDPAGVTTCYEYDLLGRTSRIHSDQGMEVQYRYDCLNRPEQITYGNGIISRYLYDADGNVSLLETKLKEETLLSFTYRYDGNGNRIEKVGEQGLVGARNRQLMTTYAYDARGQLLEERQNTGTESQDMIFRYTYDASGNRISKESREGATHYQYNEKNQLVSEEGVRGRNFFTYSRGGSIITEEKDLGTRQYSYNSKNQQVKVTCADGQTQVNHYDSEGLRYEMKENEKLFRFIYHRGELLYEEGKDEATSYQLGYGTEAIWRNQQIYYYHHDEQLSTALITDGGGQIQNQYQYGAFGEEIGSSERIPNRIRYTGQQYDGVTHQIYLRSRYYNPVLGRFMQEDVYQGDGMNLYAYCANNPVMYYDPSGYASDTFLTDELKIGTYGSFSGNKAKTTGLTPHHMVSDLYMKTNFGVATSDGLCMLMETTYKNAGGRHGMTASYGRPSQAYLGEYLSLSPRDALAYDLYDLKNVLMEQGLYDDYAKQQIREFIHQQENTRYTSDPDLLANPNFNGTLIEDEAIFSREYAQRMEQEEELELRENPC